MMVFPAQAILSLSGRPRMRVLSIIRPSFVHIGGEHHETKALGRRNSSEFYRFFY